MLVKHASRATRTVKESDKNSPSSKNLVSSFLWRKGRRAFIEQQILKLGRRDLFKHFLDCDLIETGKTSSHLVISASSVESSKSISIPVFVISRWFSSAIEFHLIEFRSTSASTFIVYTSAGWLNGTSWVCDIIIPITQVASMMGPSCWFRSILPDSVRFPLGPSVDSPTISATPYSVKCGQDRPCLSSVIKCEILATPTWPHPDECARSHVDDWRRIPVIVMLITWNRSFPHSRSNHRHDLTTRNNSHDLTESMKSDGIRWNQMKIIGIRWSATRRYRSNRKTDLCCHATTFNLITRS